MRQKKVAKILIAFLLIIILVASLAACKDSFKVHFFVNNEIYYTIKTFGNETLVLPSSPSKDGYVFDGWYLDKNTWEKPFSANMFDNIELTDDVVVYAKFITIEESINLKLNGFSTNENNEYVKNVDNTILSYDISQDISVNEHASWELFSDSACAFPVANNICLLNFGENKFYLKVNAIFAEEQLIYALNIIKEDLYIVKFNTNGGKSIPDLPVLKGAILYKEDYSTEKIGYSFTNWDFDFSNAIMQDTIISAIWEVISYDVIYNLDGGINDQENITNYSIESGNIVLKNPQKDNYNFLGWYDAEVGGKLITEIKAGSTGNITLWARWELSTFNLTYNLDGGTNHAENPSTYTVNTELTFKEPQKDGYIFLGWYDSENGGNIVEKISLGSIGHLELWAKWQLYSINLEYELKDGQYFVKGRGQNTDDIVIIPFKKDGYPVVGINSYAFQFLDINGIIIPSSITYIGAEAFDYCRNLTIYAEADSQPIGWDSQWNATINTDPITTYFGINYFEIKNDYFYVNTQQNEMVVARYYGNSALVNVPSSVNNATVVSIAERAFFDCSSMESIIVPNTITNIAERAFSNCINLKNVNLPTGLKVISRFLFENCQSLEQITLPDEITTIQVAAFSSCGELSKIALPTSLTALESRAFWNCPNLINIFIPNSVGSVQEVAFDDCPNLTIYNEAATKPSGWNNNWNNKIYNILWGVGGIFTNEDFLYVSTVENTIHILGYIGNKTTLAIPSELNKMPVKVISSSAFLDCKNLTDVTVSEGITTIAQNAFYNCEGLVSIFLPNSLAAIGANAFYNCSNLIGVTIPVNVLTVENSVFENCSKLTEVVFDSDITSIGTNAFNNCWSLVDIILPDTLETISERAFENCMSLISIIIPLNVANMGAYVFRGCLNPVAGTQLTIKAKVASQPGTWTANWNSGLTVQWGYVS